MALTSTLAAAQILGGQTRVSIAIPSSVGKATDDVRVLIYHKNIKKFEYKAKGGVAVENSLTLYDVAPGDAIKTEVYIGAVLQSGARDGTLSLLADLL